MIRIVKMHFKTEHIEDFRTLFEERKHNIRNCEGCTYLELWQDKNNPQIFYTHSHWNHENDLENYRLSPLFEDTWQTVKQWFSEKPFAFSAETLIQLP